MVATSIKDANKYEFFLNVPLPCAHQNVVTLFPVNGMFICLAMVVQACQPT